MPVWVANFVLGEYGTGAVMAVPAHDQRDFEFARKYNLPIRVVVRPADGPAAPVETLTEAVSNDGVLVQSGSHDGLPSDQARTLLTREAAAKGIGEGTVQYRLTDQAALDVHAKVNQTRPPVPPGLRVGAGERQGLDGGHAQRRESARRDRLLCLGEPAERERARGGGALRRTSHFPTMTQAVWPRALPPFRSRTRR